MGLAKPIRDYVDALVHPSVQHDALTAARHRSFIAPRLLGSFVVLAAFPMYVAFRGAPGAVEVFIIASLMAPILIAYFLSHTGRYEGAHVLSALTLTGLGTGFAAATGGIGSFATVWLVIVPLEAALSASARVVAFASALSAIGLLVLLAAQDLLPVSHYPDQPLAALGVAVAALYAVAIAIGAQSLLRTSFRLRKAEADRNRLFAGIMTDAITRHDHKGAILFASPAAEPLFGMAARELTGNGLFDRVHVADRPAYLTTLGDAATFGHERSVEFRMRRETTEPSGRNQFIWIEMRCRPLDGTPANARNQDREVIAVMRDISERKQHEQTIETLRTDIEQAAAANSKFLAFIGREQAIEKRSGNPDIKVKKRA